MHETLRLSNPPETCPKFVYIFKLGLEATSAQRVIDGVMGDHPNETPQC
jgi:hypothetical protein